MLIHVFACEYHNCASIKSLTDLEVKINLITFITF